MCSSKSKKNIGLLISERVMGLSLEVIPPLYKGFPDDLEFTRK